MAVPVGPLWGEMRLICPNCNAQYEVDDSVIPDTGRDVQCSGCGQTWFQPSASAIAAYKAEKSEEDTLPAPESWDGAMEHSDIEADFSEPDFGEEVDTEAEDLAAEVAAQPPAHPDQIRRTIDESLLAVLREEAEREAKARKAESRPLEMQPDLGLHEPQPVPNFVERPQPRPPADPAASAARPHVQHSAQLRPDPEDTTSRRAEGRERLPDIEEINSTLRSASDRGGAPAAVEPPKVMARRRSGFRLGFGAVVMVCAAGIALYAYAPRLGAWMPQLQPTLSAYTASVDAGRFWLDEKIREATLELRRSR